MTILDFNLRVPEDRLNALDERDELIALLEKRGYHLLMTDDGTRVLMEKMSQRPKVAGCGCECNRGGFCGGCGHAGCGRRRA